MKRIVTGHNSEGKSIVFIEDEAVRKTVVPNLPDIAATLEPDFMHTTETIDYNIVLSGERWCELDDGGEVHLKAGDCLVQCGTRHAWRNKGSEMCVKAAIMVGAVCS